MGLSFGCAYNVIPDTEQQGVTQDVTVGKDASVAEQLYRRCLGYLVVHCVAYVTKI